MQYVVHMDVINGDGFEEVFQTEKEAVSYAEWHWSHLTKGEKEKNHYYVAGYDKYFIDPEGDVADDPKAIAIVWDCRPTFCNMWWVVRVRESGYILDGFDDLDTARLKLDFYYDTDVEDYEDHPEEYTEAPTREYYEIAHWDGTLYETYE